MVQKGQLVFGREKEIQLILNFAKGEPIDLPAAEETKDTATSNENPREDETSNGVPPLIVVADPGQGKSSLMAKAVMEARKVGQNRLNINVGF